MAGLLTKAPPGTGPPKCQEGGRGYAGLPYSVQYEQLAAYLCKTAFYCFFLLVPERFVLILSVGL
jgi:hypothetical protein